MICYDSKKSNSRRTLRSFVLIFTKCLRLQSWDGVLAADDTWIKMNCRYRKNDVKYISRAEPLSTLVQVHEPPWYKSFRTCASITKNKNIYLHGLCCLLRGLILLLKYYVLSQANIISIQPWSSVLWCIQWDWIFLNFLVTNKF